MSSNADFDRALNAGIDLINKDRQYSPGLKLQPNAELLAELMDDMKEEEAEYATFDTDMPKLSIRQRALLAIIMIVLVFAALWAGEWFVSDGLPALFGDRATHQVEQPSTPAQVPNMEKAIEEAISGYSASIVPPPAGNAPTQNGSTSGDVIIPFGALPKLIEIDTAPATASSMSDGAAGHMEKLEPIRAW